MRRGTYLIVARDPASGELGVAVQSHWFAVGSVAAWARPGAGAAAAQSVAEVAHGPHVLDRLAEGRDPEGAIAAVLRDDELARYRRLGAVDAGGRSAAHTGDGCIPHAGEVVGEGFACQANMMAGSSVPAAMAEAYRAGAGDLADRLLATLDAGEAAGGDVRGRQSASLLLVPASARPGGHASTFASMTTRTRSRSCAGSCACAPTSSPARPMSGLRTVPAPRPALSSCKRHSSRPRSTSSPSGPALAWPPRI